MDDKIYYQDLTELNRRLSVMETALNSMRNRISMDEREQVDTLKNMMVATQAQVYENSRLFNEAMGTRRGITETTILDDATYREVSRRADEQRRKESPAYQERVAFLRKVAFESDVVMLDEVCDCGQHYAVQVVHNGEDHEIVVDSICPQQYWLYLSQAHNLQGNLIKFLQDLPLTTFLGWYMSEPATE